MPSINPERLEEELDPDPTDPDPDQGGSQPAGLAEMGIPVIHVSEDAATASDRSLAEIEEACTAKGVPIRVRVPLMLWNPETFQYKSWRGEIWKVEVKNGTEAEKLLGAMEAFFRSLSRLGAEKVRTTLESATAGE